MFEVDPSTASSHLVCCYKLRGGGGEHDPSEGGGHDPSTGGQGGGEHDPSTASSHLDHCYKHLGGGVNERMALTSTTAML